MYQGFQGTERPYSMILIPKNTERLYFNFIEILKAILGKDFITWEKMGTREIRV